MALSFSKTTGIIKTLACVGVFMLLVWSMVVGLQTFHQRIGPIDYCNVSCTTGVPCQYPDELDLRIIVLTYNRPQSLKKCLAKIAEIDTLGHRVGIDIWIDRSANGNIDQATFNISRDFQLEWQARRVCVHIQASSAYIIGQWVDTWRPRKNSPEMALFIEDDIDISKYAYKWLKSVDSHFRSLPDVAGYTLQMENVNFVKGGQRHAEIPGDDPVFLYRLLGTWGYAPKPQHWRNFQDWFHKVRKDKDFKPYIKGTVLYHWYRSFETRGVQDSMWEMWPIYYHYMHNLYTVYANLGAYTGREDILLDTNRLETGLHSGKRHVKDKARSLMASWDEQYVNFPAVITRYNFDGTNDRNISTSHWEHIKKEFDIPTKLLNE